MYFIFKLAVTFLKVASSHSKTTDMQKKFWITPGIIAAILVASLLALSNPKTAKSEQKPTCCKKTINKCSPKEEKSSPGQTTLDNLSSQFILVPFLSY